MSQDINERTRPQHREPRGDHSGVSARLATFRPSAETPIEELVDLIEDEACRTLSAADAACWLSHDSANTLYRQSARAGQQRASLAVEDLGLSVDGLGLWRRPFGSALDHLIEASFGGRDDYRQDDVLAMPIELGPDRTGVLLLLYRNRTSGDQPPWAMQFGAQVSNVIAHHELALHQSTATSVLEALNDTAAELASGLELESILQSLVIRVQTITEVPVAYVMLVQGDGHIRMDAVTGVTRSDFVELDLPFGVGLGGLTAEMQKVYQTQDYLNDRRFVHDPRTDLIVRGERIRSIVGVPLMAVDEFVGVLYGADRIPRAFSARELDALETIAKHAALAISNARLYQATSDALRAETAARTTIDQQHRRLRFIDEVHSRTVEAVLADGSLESVLATISDLIGGTAVVYNARGSPITVGRDGASGEVDVNQSQFVELEWIADALEPAEDGTSALRLYSQPERIGATAVVPVVVHEQLVGVLALDLPGGNAEASAQIALESARAVGLALMHERARAEAEREFGRAFLEDLAGRREAEIVHRHALEVGIDIDRGVRVAMIAVSDGVTRARQRRMVIDRLVTLAMDMEWCEFAGDTGEHAILLIDSAAGEIERDLIQLFDAAGAKRFTRAVLAPSANEVEGLRRSYRTCERVLQSSDDGLPGGVIDLERARVLSLLFSTGADGRDPGQFVRDVLGPVLELDEPQRSELLKTLQAYLELNTSPSKAAKALSVHVNTLYYRLNRLRSLLGPDFDDIARSLSIRVALVARALMSLDDQGGAHLEQ